MAHALADPWSQGFVQRAFLELALLGIVGSALGCWVLFYELSYGAESLAHALFPGLVLAALAGAPLVLGAVGGVLVAAAAVAAFGRTPEIGRDTAIAVVITTLFGLGVLLALASASPPGLNELLFGDLLGVSGTDLAIAAALGAIVLTSLVLLHRQLLAVGFDRVNAAAFGARPVLVDLSLLGLLAAAIVIGVQGLGNLLVLAVLIGPAATARVLTRRLLPMMSLAAVIAIACGAGGLYLSYYAETAGGASVAGITLAAYLGVRLTAVAR
ncbi:MAG TPA: metal ABC transporter permease [Gaiellaceae bacterium]|nr:metal ABC transporter permease [Gaiellaceae bacterium]